jgi:predicted CXXCH cytochrome family protein
MGSSITAPVPEAQVERSWRHSASGRMAGVAWKGGALIHTLAGSGQRATYETAYAVGSGNHGKSYLIRVGDSLFQSPLAWYTESRTWDFSPGYHENPAPDFFRPVTVECLFCHAGEARAVRGSQNRYLDPPFAAAPIGCARCHGDPSRHLGEPRPGSIVNPAKLPPALRDSVCESCHLSGDARVLNPGRQLSDFRPGMLLEDVFSVYVPAKSGANRPLKVVSHSEQLAASACAAAGERLWCGACHDPHRSPRETERAGWYRARCLECHQGAAVAQHENRRGDDCARCHMPRSKAYDGGHTAFTDHWIRRSPGSEQPAQTQEALRAWREPPEPIRIRNLALAYIGNSQTSKSLWRYREGVRLLNSVANTQADGAVAVVVGLQLMRQNEPAKAVFWLRRASLEEPENSLRRLTLAAALAAAGEAQAAGREAREAIRLEPLLEEAYTLLAEVEPERAGYWRQQYSKLVPQRLPR